MRISLTLFLATLCSTAAIAQGKPPCPYVQKKLFTNLSNDPYIYSSTVYDFSSPLSVLLKNANKDHNFYLDVVWKKAIDGPESGDSFTGDIKKGEGFEIPFFEDLDIRRQYKDISIEYSRQDFDRLEMIVDMRDLSCT